MSRYLGIIFAICFTGCRVQQLAPNGVNANAEADDMSEDEEAANTLYLDDLLDSAGSDDAQDGPEDGSVADDRRMRHLEQMAQMMLDTLDGDKNSMLGLDEVMMWVEKRPQFGHGGQPPAVTPEDIKAKMKERITNHFNKYAGDDGLLSSEEVLLFLKAQSGRVGRFRHKKHPGPMHQEMLKAKRMDLIRVFDKNGDGALDDAEKEAMKSEMRGKREGWKKRDQHIGHRRDEDYRDRPNDDILPPLPPGPGAAPTPQP